VSDVDSTRRTSNGERAAGPGLSTVGLWVADTSMQAGPDLLTTSAFGPGSRKTSRSVVFTPAYACGARVGGSGRYVAFSGWGIEDVEEAELSVVSIVPGSRILGEPTAMVRPSV
jgi:hypothetical protein